MKPYIDLHTHTLLSDGVLTSREVVAKAYGEEVKGAPCGKCFQLNSTHIPPLKQDDFDTMAFLPISQA